MSGIPDPVPRPGPRRVSRKLGSLTETATFIRILPDEQRLVNGPKGIDLKFVIGIFPGDEYLNIIFLPDRLISSGHGGGKEGLLDPETHV
jgi:hypothetical protein